MPGLLVQMFSALLKVVWWQQPALEVGKNPVFLSDFYHYNKP